jgi:hypothetical protein
MARADHGRKLIKLLAKKVIGRRLDMSSFLVTNSRL